MTKVAASAEPLPRADRDDYSITELCSEFGVTARALRFYEDEGLISPERRGTFNTFVSHVEETGLPILLSFANGHTAVRYDRQLSDEEVKDAALASLRRMFGDNKVPDPEAMVFPRWLSDPWTKGGYSYPAIGSPPEDHDDHARPLGDRVFFYHSGYGEQEIVGECEVAREGYVDHTAFDVKHRHYDKESKQDDPQWYMVDLRAVAQYTKPVTLAQMKLKHALREMALLRVGRLSVSPVTDKEYKVITGMAK